MIIIEGVKYACERCIRGHRVTKCSHSDGPLVVIKPKGRPSTVCDYCKSLKKNHNSNPTGSCVCGRQKKLEEKKKKLLEEKKARKLKDNVLLHEANGNLHDNIINNDDVFSSQSSLLSVDANHAISCSCYETGICNCHKKRKNGLFNRQRKPTAGISKRRNSNSSYDISSKFLGSHQSDYASINSGFDNSSLYSYDSFSNAIVFPNSNNYQSKISPTSQPNSTPGLLTSLNSTNIHTAMETTTSDVLVNPSPDDKNVQVGRIMSPLSSNMNTYLNGNSEFLNSSMKSTSALDMLSLNNPNTLVPTSSHHNPKKATSISNLQNLDNDYMHLNEHRKTQWQLLHSNGMKKVESLQSFSTNNDPLTNRKDSQGMNYNFLESSRPSHGLLDNVEASTKYEVNSYLDSLDKNNKQFRFNGEIDGQLQHFQNKNMVKNNRVKSGNSSLVSSNLYERQFFENNSGVNTRPPFSRNSSKHDDRRQVHKATSSNNVGKILMPESSATFSQSDILESKTLSSGDAINNDFQTFEFNKDLSLFDDKMKTNDIPTLNANNAMFDELLLDSFKNPNKNKADGSILTEMNKTNTTTVNSSQKNNSLPHLSNEFLEILNDSSGALFSDFPEPKLSNTIPIDYNGNANFLAQNDAAKVETGNNEGLEDQNDAVVLSLRPGSFSLSNILGTIGNDENRRSSYQDSNVNYDSHLL